MNDFHFLRPNLLYLFIPFFILMFLLLRSNRSANIWNQVCAKDLLPYILERKAKRLSLPSILIFTIGSLLITAAAGPAWQMISQPLIKSQTGLVIALDLSASMNAEDIKPSRLQRAIYKLNDILNLRQEGQTALIVFSEEPFVVTPLTEDIATIKALLPVLEPKIMPSAGHQVHKAITKAAELLAQANIANGSILLVTAELSKQDLEKAIEIATKREVKVSVLGVGTEEGTPISKQEGGFIKDEKGALVISALSKENLNRLAKSTKGSYATIRLDDEDINALAKGFSGRVHSQEQIGLKQDKWHDQGYWLVLLALPFASLFFRRGMLMITLFLLPQALQAFAWDDLWKTPNQQAEQLFHQKEYQHAKELFQNPDWQAAANYQLGDYQTAANLYQRNQSAEGYYNYGTAKAKQGDFETALEAYRKTLELQPDHADALYNKKMIEEFMQQEKEKNQEQQDQKNQQNQDQNKEQQKSKEPNQEKNEGPNQKPDNQQKSEHDSSDNKENDSEQRDERQAEELQDQFRDQIEKDIQEDQMNKDEKKQAEEQASPEENSPENDPQRQIDERWLQRVKDDPGGLLRRKFLQQYQQQNRAKQLNGDHR